MSANKNQSRITPYSSSPLLPLPPAGGERLRVGPWLILLCCITLFSCGDLKEVSFSGVENITLTSLSQSGVEALITVRVKNPNNVSFTIYKSAMDVTISGINAGKARLTNNVRIKAKSEDLYTFKIKSDFSNLSLADMPKIIAMGLSKNVKVGLKGNLKSGKLFIKRSYPIDITQNVPLGGF